ncbi:MAG: SDR family oxidoreductase [Ardenticatenaceae bacterium]|nr:SDR family oxidoreductase [Ardenticatenaceae bacterium]HBY95746.1 hypothetical protein [Chloroflexota bacterium]
MTGSEPLRLEGRVALITGAGRGLGWGVARGLARAGARVAILDINSEELEQTLADIALDGGEALPLIADVSVFTDMQQAVEQIVARWGRLDVVINNAAIMPLVPFDEMSPPLWQKIIAVNLTGVYNGVKAAWEQLKLQGGGHCIAIASGSSVRGFVNEVAYCAAKHGLEGFTKALAVEAEPYHIAVNTMGPGKIIKPTSITRDAAAHMSHDQQARWADPLELAPGFVWLAAQPPARFSGLRFDAGVIADTIAAEGFEFDVTPEKVTAYPADFAEREAQRMHWTHLAPDA